MTLVCDGLGGLLVGPGVHLKPPLTEGVRCPSLRLGGVKAKPGRIWKGRQASNGRTIKYIIILLFIIIYIYIYISYIQKHVSDVCFLLLLLVLLLQLLVVVEDLAQFWVEVITVSLHQCSQNVPSPNFVRQPFKQHQRKLRKAWAVRQPRVKGYLVMFREVHVQPLKQTWNIASNVCKTLEFYSILYKYLYRYQENQFDNISQHYDKLWQWKSIHPHLSLWGRWTLSRSGHGRRGSTPHRPWLCGAPAALLVALEHFAAELPGTIATTLQLTWWQKHVSSFGKDWQLYIRRPLAT